MTADPTALTRSWRRVREQALTLAQHPDGAVPSPCQSVCVMHAPSGWCEGCLRTLSEIAEWSRMGPTAQRQVWAALPERMAQRASQAAA